VLHYTRIDPTSGRDQRYLAWRRLLRPVESTAAAGGWEVEVGSWREVEFHGYSNEEPFAVISDVPSLDPGSR
jgi:hypothetical protein